MSKVKKLFNPSKTKLWWLYLVLATALIVCGVFFMPIWGGTDVFWKDWGSKAVCACIGAVILIYLFTFLIKKLKSGGAGAVKVLTIIEFVLLLLTAVACILLTFGISLGIPTEKNACTILGIAFYCRGVVEIFRAYYHKKSSSNYPLWWLGVAVAFVTLGCWMFFRPFFSNATIQWIMSVGFICLGVVFIVLAFVAKPASKK